MSTANLLETKGLTKVDYSFKAFNIVNVEEGIFAVLIYKSG